MNLTLQDFYRIGKQSVQLFPQNLQKTCLQPKAFRVLQRERGTELGSDNLGAVPTDKDNPFFWSLQWHNNKYNPNALTFEYPLVTMFEIIAEGEKAFSGQIKKFYTIEISVLDVFSEDCEKPGTIGCAGRSINQIYFDTGTILDSILQYFGGMVGAYTSADPVVKLYYKPWLDAQKLSGAITSYQIEYDMQNTLNTNNPKTRFTRVEKSATRQIYGTKTQVTFCTTNCPTIEYDTSLPDFGLLSFEAGCKNC